MKREHRTPSTVVPGRTSLLLSVTDDMKIMNAVTWQTSTIRSCTSSSSSSSSSSSTSLKIGMSCRPTTTCGLPCSGGSTRDHALHARWRCRGSPQQSDKQNALELAIFRRLDLSLEDSRLVCRLPSRANEKSIEPSRHSADAPVISAGGHLETESVHGAFWLSW